MDEGQADGASDGALSERLEHGRLLVLGRFLQRLAVLVFLRVEQLSDFTQLFRRRRLRRQRLEDQTTARSAKGEIDEVANQPFLDRALRAFGAVDVESS